ncbi:hypothetical protein BSKO_01698 [Bryopsis sp. KO-2023]|nr:hypothetical protein BSKO_01698 [Bryopsis sp. KO-2023]
MAHQVIRGCLKRIWDKEENIGDAIVQVLESRRVGQGDRMRMDLTDLNHCAKAMVGTQWCGVAANETPPGSIVKLTNYVMNVVTGKRVFIVLSYDVIGHAPVPTHSIDRLERIADTQPAQGDQNQSRPAPTAPPQQAQTMNQAPVTNNAPPAMAQGPNGNQQGRGGPMGGVQSSHGQTNVPSAQASVGGYGPPARTGGYGGGAPVGQTGGYGGGAPVGQTGGYGGNAGGYGAGQNQGGGQTGGYGGGQNQNRVQTGVQGRYGPPRPQGGYGAGQQGGYGAGQQGGYGAGQQGGYGAGQQGGYGGGQQGGYGGGQQGGYGGGQQGGYGGGQQGGQNQNRGYGGGSVGGGYGSSSTVCRPQYNTNQGPVARNEAPAEITPIAHLNPYMNRWTIMGRCTNKADIRRYSNSKGEGSVFSFDLLDKDGGEIRVTGFNREVDELEPLVELGKIFTLTKATVKPKRGRFNQTNHAFELMLGQMSKIDPVVEDAATQEIPHIQYLFKEIMEVQQMEKGTLMDVLGVVESIQPWVMITLKTGNETPKRSLMIRDRSNCDIELALWGEAQAGGIGDEINQAVEGGQDPIVSVKNVRVGDFNGKNLSTIGSSRIEINADIPEVAELRQWYNGGGKGMQANSLSNNRASGKSNKRITVGDIPSQLNNSDGKPVYVEVVGPVSFIRRENMYYAACQNDNGGRACRKKLREENDEWFCDRCNAASEPDWRYLLSIAIKDHFGMQFLTAFGDEGTQILGRQAANLRELDGTEEFNDVIANALFATRKFVLKIFEDNYNDETRVKTTIVRQEALDYAKESKHLLSEIQQYLSGGGTMNTNTAMDGVSQQGGGTPFNSANRGYQPPPQQGGGGGWGNTFAR